MKKQIRAKWLPIKTRLKWSLKSRSGWILGRMACMGNDVAKILNPKFPVLNVQKGRVDYLVDVNRGRSHVAQTDVVAPHLRRDDIIGLIAQEECAEFLPSAKPEAILMDSFSELTDQRFFHKDHNWSFVSNYSDVDHDDVFKSKFECAGLLPETEFEKYYRIFFEFLDERYGPVPTIFMNFPSKLESRLTFRHRHDLIKSAIRRLGVDRPTLVSFDVPEELVDWPSIQDQAKFPYHYNLETYDYLASQIRQHSHARLIVTQ